MTSRLLVAVIGMLSLLAAEPIGGSSLQQLPPDGTWAKSQVSITLAGQEVSATWTARSVGQTTHNGQPCRWIELQQESDSSGFPKMTWRCLVPEAEFGAGKHPLGKSVKVWQKIEGQDAQAVDSIEAKDYLFGALLKGPEQNLRAEDAPEIVKWQKGDMECQVIAGDSEGKLNGVIRVPIHHRIFRHPNAPFGMGGVHWVLTLGDGDQKQTVNVKMTLQDQGTDAKAQLPELGI